MEYKYIITLIIGLILGFLICSLYREEFRQNIIKDAAITNPASWT